MRKAESEILFGSTIRGDSDELSDQDILIVDSNHNLLRERKNQLASQGYSVGAYTWNRFNKLYLKKSLFVQHLKQEGVILEDENGKLQKALYEFSPKQSYNDELHENKKLFDLLGLYPDSPKGHLWASDLLYVAIRNHGILFLASYGEYVFSYEAIIDKLSQYGIIDKKNCNKLVGLRFLKSLYRSENISLNSNVHLMVKENIENLNNIYTGEIKSANPKECFELMMDNIDTNCPYHCLRNIEKNYITVVSLYPSLQSQKQFKKILGLIKDPRSYAFLAAKNQSDISKLFLSYKPQN